MVPGAITMVNLPFRQSSRRLYLTTIRWTGGSGTCPPPFHISLQTSQRTSHRRTSTPLHLHLDPNPFFSSTPALDQTGRTAI